MLSYRSWRSPLLRIAAMLTLLAAPVSFAGAAADDPALDLVAVGIVGRGRAIVLATPGIPREGHLWRFRALDTSALPQPIDHVVLASSGTKLFLQPHEGPGGVLDLTWQGGQRERLQYIDARDLTANGIGQRQSHRLPRQRFLSIHDGVAYVIDDSGVVQAEYPPVAATSGAISDEGAVLYVRPDRGLMVCGETPGRRAECRDLPGRADENLIAISARSLPRPSSGSAGRFLLLNRVAERARVVDPERAGGDEPIVSRIEGSLRACLALHQVSISNQRIALLARALESESESVSSAASPGEPIADWRFFRVATDEDLYAPVLEFARRETVFPSAFDMLAGLKRASPGANSVGELYERYLRLDNGTKRGACTIHFRTHSSWGSWFIEYWFYYPFDVGGLDSHLHDPEHLFVEVDKLGGRVSRVIGAGHGYLAGNNIYSAERAGAFAADLPLFAIVELGKHATAPDMDRNGVFTPGLDENEYRERAKVWGVRDVIGTINNQLLAYDSTMTVPRRPDDYLAVASVTTRFPDVVELGTHASCRLEPIPQRGTDLTPCDEPTTDCATRYVTTHPDFRKQTTIFKEWVFPRSFLRASYVLGPRRDLHSVGVGYAMDLDAIRGVRFVSLPGRLGAEVYVWHQDVNDADTDSCLRGCRHAAGVGFGFRYEQFLSNLFGIFSSVRVYSPPVADAWVTFGPLVEVPLFNHSNVNVEGGLSFRPAASPRFELRVSVGLWKPRVARVGMRAADP
jgi:hypothetical protein